MKYQKNASAAKREAEELLCRKCVRLKCNLERQVRRTNEESSSKKIKRQSTTRARLAYMSPTSQAKRKGNQKTCMSRKLSHYFAKKITLDEDQNEELSNVMTVIEGKCRKELDDIFIEGELCKKLSLLLFIVLFKGYKYRAFLGYFLLTQNDCMIIQIMCTYSYCQKKIIH